MRGHAVKPAAGLAWSSMAGFDRPETVISLKLTSWLLLTE